MIIDKEFYLNVIIEMRYIKALEYKKNNYNFTASWYIRENFSLCCNL